MTDPRIQRSGLSSVPLLEYSLQMLSCFNRLNLAFRVAAATALLLSGPARGRAAEEDEETAQWFLVERMAVDPLVNQAPVEESYHQGRMRTLRLQRGEVGPPSLNPPDITLAPVTQEDLRKAEDHMKRANRYQAEQEPNKALLEMRDALVYARNNTDLLRTAARLALDLQKFTMAETFARQYLTRIPDDPDMMALRATALLRLSRVPDARATVESALAVHPDHLICRMLAVEIQLLREDRNLTTTFWRQRRFDQLTDVTRLLLLHQKTIEASLGLDDFLLYCDTLLGEGTGLLLERIFDLQVKILNPANPGQSEQELETVLTLKRTGFTCFGLDAIETEIYRRLGRKADADRLWSEIRKRYAEAPDAHLNFGRYSLLEGRPEDAEKAILECRRLAGQDSEIVRFLLAVSYSLQGKAEEATGLFNELALRNRDQFRSWMEMDPVFEDAVNRMPNAKAILRLLDIPPESE